MPSDKTIKLFQVEHYGESFCYAAYDAEAVRAFHLELEGEDEPIESIVECPPDKEWKIGGDTDEGDEPPGGRFEDGRAIGTTEQWLATVTLREDWPVHPMWSTVY